MVYQEKKLSCKLSIYVVLFSFCDVPLCVNLGLGLSFCSSWVLKNDKGPLGAEPLPFRTPV